MWTVAIKDTQTGEIRLMLEEERGTIMDLVRFERHIVPCEQEGDEIVFGIHKLTRGCPCRPQIKFDNYGYESVHHEDRKPT
jgi:hypothetical protein